VKCWDWEEEERWWEQRSERVEGSQGSRVWEGAYIIYTSGTTGKPKGVLIGHQGVASLVEAQREKFELTPESRVLQYSSMGFDAMVMEILMSVCVGASLVIPTERKLVGDGLSEFLRKQEISHALLTPALLNTVSALPETFTCLIAGGDIVTGAMVERWGRGRKMFNAYGPTECTICACISGAMRAGHEVTIGGPIANTRIYILDERGEPVPVGVVGEIYIGGAGVGMGYWKREEMTAERFVADPYVEEGGMRMYRTGDLGRWRGDGRIEFCGRQDSQVKVRGYRVELGEIEARLREVRGVGETVVVVREEEERGEKRLVAYYTWAGNGEEAEEAEEAKEAKEAEEAEEVSAEDLRAAMTAVLPDYMVPAAYVRLEQLPLTPSGKVDRRRLPAPDAEAYARTEYEEPQGETEQALAAIWAELLKVEQISRHDNFFSLGGHSLLAVRMVNALRARFDWVIPVRDVFAYPVLYELADRVVMARLNRFDPADLMKVLGTHAID
jgi:amino acid adenylation domain-containing protein